MRKTSIAVLSGLLLALATQVQAAAVDDLQAQLRAQGAGPFSAAAGDTLWHSQSAHAGKPRSCASCHGTDLTKSGRHVTTGKVIEPMAPSVNPQRLTDVAKMQKWLKRNCHWTFGRQCTAQEQGDILAYLRTL